MRSTQIVAVLIGLFTPILSAQAADLQVLTAGAAYDAEKELAEGFTKQTGIKVVLMTGSVGQTRAKLKAGTPADIVVLSAEVLDAIGKEGALKPGAPKVPLGRAVLGLAVKAGAPKPDISTEPKFRAALLAAKSVAYGDPKNGSSAGAIVDTLFKQSAYAGVKGVPIAGTPLDKLPTGEAELAVQTVSEILPRKDVALVGPFPASLNAAVKYSAGIPAKAVSPKEAQAFLAYITRPESKAVWKAKGVEP